MSKKAGKYIISTNGYIGPFDSLAEAEFFAQHTVAKYLELYRKRKLSVLVAEVVSEVGASDIA